MFYRTELTVTSTVFSCMRIKKARFDGQDTFNEYDCTFSYGQLTAMRNALEKDHSDPISDELHAELNYYLQNIPGPGESSDEFKEQRDAAQKSEEEAGSEVEGGEAPTDTEVEAGQLPPPPSEEEEGEPAGMPPMGGEEGAEGGEGGEEYKEGPELSPEEREIIDRAMPTSRPTGTPSPLGKAKGILLPPPPMD